MSFSQQWKRDSVNPPSATPTAISGATGTTYSLVAADIGNYIFCDVTALNSSGFAATARSNVVGPIISAGYSIYALALDFKNGAYWKSGTQYSDLTGLPGYSYTRSGGKGELNLSGTRLYGPEIHSNGSFDVNVVGWTSTNLTAVWNNGAALLTKTADVNSFSQVNSILTSGKYRFQARLVVSERARIQFPGGAFINGAPWTTSVPGTFDVDFELISAYPAGNIETSFQLADSTTWAANGATISVEYASLKRIIDGVGYIPANAPGIIPGVGYWSRGALTNYFTQSQTVASWNNLVNHTVVSDNAVAPDGLSTADTVTEAAVTGNFYVGNGASGPTAASPQTHAVFIKYVARQWFYYSVYDGGLTKGCYFDVQNGVVGSADAGVTGYIVSHGGGWYRIVITGSVWGSNARSDLRPASSNGTMITTSAGGISTQVWHGQSLNGTFPNGGPIIVTTTTSGSIGADVMYLTNPSPSADAFFWCVTNIAASQPLRAFSLTTSSLSTHYQVLRDVNASNFGLQKDNAASVASISFAGTSGGRTVFGLRRRSNKWTLFVRNSGTTTTGVEGATDTIGTLDRVYPQGGYSGGDGGSQEGFFSKDGTFTDADCQTILGAA